MKRRLLPFLVLAGILALGFLAACNGSSSEALTIYSGRSESLVDPIIQQFSDATGIDVKVKYASTPQLATTLKEEGDNSPADLFFAQDPGGLGSVEEMLSPLPQNILDKVPSWARSDQGSWVGISGRARVVVYNTDNVAPEDLPKDLWGFTDPQWKDRIGWPTTNASFQTMVTGMRSVWGEEKTRQWLQGIKDNNAKFYDQNTPTVQAVGSGEIDVGFVNHYYLYRFLSAEGESFPARNYHTTSGGPGALVMVAGAGILSTAKNRPEAEKFLEFMLSKVAQEYFASRTFEYPLVKGVTVDRRLTPLEEINQPQVSPKNLSDLAGTQDLLREVGVLP